MKSQNECGSVDHRWHRRSFLQGLAAGSAASMFSFEGLFGSEPLAQAARSQGKRVILLWLCGAPSQFETWDPKPRTETGGPFGSTPTSIPGVHFSELMPHCATIADKLTVVRSMSTEPSEHFQAIDLLTRGEKPRPPFTRPIFGSVIADQFGDPSSPLPQFVFLDPCPEGNEFKAFKAGNWSGWLGAEQAPVRIGGEYQIENIDRPEQLSQDDFLRREALRHQLSRSYADRVQSDVAGSFDAPFARVPGLMQSAHHFDLEQLPQKDRDRYGPGAFAQHTLQARHLIEQGVTFVMVANGMPWDCHVLNHEIHQMLVPELDKVLFELVTDLDERGLLDDTLVLAMGEFGRTPWLNEARGRDHYPNAWSMAMAGAGVQPGVVYGATDDLGIEVVDGKMDQRRLFATIYQALGLDPHQTYDLPGLPTFHRVEQDAEPVTELLRGV